MLAPSNVEIVLYTGLGDLPHFNPDLDTDSPPETVAALRHQVGRCDGLLICSPEYAHGVAGAMKNALDWLVSSLEFPGKPVALFNTSPRATHAQAHLRETLRTMSARLVDEASITIPFFGRTLDHIGIASDEDLAKPVRNAIENFARSIGMAQV